MDSKNWTPDQGSESTLDTIDWRTQLDPESRQRIVNKIMDTLKKSLPLSGTEGLLELRKIAQRFEDKVYTAAVSQSDYLRKISIKMLTMETKSQSTIASNMTSNEGGPSNNPPDQDDSDSMDSNNWIPDQGSEPTLDTIDWRTQLDPDSRQRIVNKIMDTLKKLLPLSGTEGLLELRKIAQKFEDKIYTAATSKFDYLRKISIKMITMETKSQSSIASNMTSNEGGPSNNPPDQGLVLQSQVLNPGQQHPNPHQQLLPQTIQNHVAPQPNLPSVSTLSQTPSQNISIYSNTQQPVQNSASNFIGQNSNMRGMFPGSQRQMPGRQQVVPPQQQQLPQNQQILYQQQQQVMKHKLSQMQQQRQQQNLLQPNQLNTSQQSVMQTSSASTMQSFLSSLQQNQQSNNVQQSTQVMKHILSQMQQHQQPQNQQILYQQQQQVMKHKLSQMQQQQQQNLLQPNQLTTSQQSVMQTTSAMQPSTMQSFLSSLQQNQQSNNVQQSKQVMKHMLSQMQQQQQQNLLQSNQLNTSQQSVMQTSSVMQPLMMQSILSSLQQNQQSNNVQQSTQSRLQQHSQIIRQQQQHNSIAQQQQTPMLQQLLINQQNNLTNVHQQLLGNNVPGLLQQQQFGTDIGNQGIQTSHHSAHMLQQPKFSMQPQLQHNASKLLPSQSQQSQPQASPQQLMPQIQNQLAQMQQQMGLQQQPSSLQREMQQNLQASGSLHQQQSVIDQQKQLYQSQRALPETSTNSTTHTEQLSGGDGQEELYQKLQTMKEDYLPDLNEIFQEIAMRLQQYDSTPQQPKSDQIEKLSVYRLILERVILFLQLPKNRITHNFKENLGACEKHIVNLINSFRPRKGISSLQPGQLPPTHTSSMPQSQSQVTSVQSHENQMISQIQPSYLQGSAATLQQNNAVSLQHNSMSGLTTTQQNMLNIIHRSNNVDAGQGNSMNSLQNVPLSSLQQNNVSTPQQTNINSLSSQGGVNVIQPNLNTHQSGQNSGYSNHQLKQMNPFQVASPQLFQAASPQIPQHSSPQVDQQTQQQSLAKVATPLQSSNSPFGLPTPSPPMAPSPILVDSEKPVPGVSSSSAANVGQHTGGAAAPAQSLAIRTHGISASPLLAEFSGLDDAYFNAFTTISGKDFGKEFGKELLKETRSKKIEKLKKEVESITMKMKLLILVLICFWVLFVLFYKSM